MSFTPVTKSMTTLLQYGSNLGITSGQTWNLGNHSEGDLLLLVEMNGDANKNLQFIGFTRVGPFVSGNSDVYLHYKQLTDTSSSTVITNSTVTVSANSGIGISAIIIQGAKVIKSGVRATAGTAYVESDSGSNCLITVVNGTPAPLVSQGFTVWQTTHSNTTIGTFTAAWKPFDTNVSYTSSSLWGVGSCQEYLVITSYGIPPTDTIILNKSIIMDNSLVSIQGIINHPTSGNTVKYRITKGGIIYQDWTAYLPTPISLNIDLGIFGLGVTNLLVEYTDSIYQILESRSYTVSRKITESVHVDYSNPSINFSNKPDEVSNLCTTLLKINIDPTKGYIDKTLMSINISSGIIGTVKIGLISSTWKTSEVTYNTKPILDNTVLTFSVALGVNSIDISSLIKKLYSQSNYGIYISTDTSTNIMLDPISTTISTTYRLTELIQPKIIYGNRFLLSWKNIIFYKPESIQYIQIWRDTNVNFTSEIEIFQTSNLSITQFLDTGLTNGNYFYRLKVIFVHNTYNGDQLDFDTVDSSLFVQDPTKTEIIGGLARMKLTGSTYAIGTGKIETGINQFNTVDWMEIDSITVTQSTLLWSDTSNIVASYNLPSGVELVNSTIQIKSTV